MSRTAERREGPQERVGWLQEAVETTEPISSENSNYQQDLRRRLLGVLAGSRGRYVARAKQ